jgi:hypothetical protein
MDKEKINNGRQTLHRTLKIGSLVVSFHQFGDFLSVLWFSPHIKTTAPIPTIFCTRGEHANHYTTDAVLNESHLSNMSIVLPWNLIYLFDFQMKKQPLQS